MSRSDENGLVEPIETIEPVIDAALERQPRMEVPTDFAARVAYRAAALPQRSRTRRTNYGRTIAFVAIVVLAVALFALAPHATPSLTNLGFVMEMVLLLQLGGLLYWLMRTGREMI